MSVLGSWTDQGWGPPAGWVADPNNPGWAYDPNGDPNQEDSWWQAPSTPPAGYSPDPNNPGWYLADGSDPANDASWWHDETVDDDPDFFTADEIHTVSWGASTDTIAENWPGLVSGLQAAGCADLPTTIAVLATIRVEVPPFAPIREYGSDAYFTSMYGPGTSAGRQLGNVYAGDGARYCGRGYVQLTGRANYTKYGAAFGIDLAGNPDLALDPTVAALVLVKYCTDHNVPGLAAAGDWQGVRRAVNGGLNGWATFAAAVNAYMAIAQGKGLV